MDTLFPVDYSTERVILDPRHIKNTILEDLDLSGPEPTPAFMKSIREDGVIYPPEIARLLDGSLFVVDGKRRIKAAMKIGLAQIDILVRYEVPREVAIRWQMQSEKRSPNPISAVNALKELMSQGITGERELADKVGLTVTGVRQALAISSLPDEILRGVEAGKIAMSTAREVAKLNGDAGKAVAILQQKGKLTADDVRDLHRVKAAALGTQLSAAPISVESVRKVLYISLSNSNVLYLGDDLDEAEQAGGIAYKLIPV